MVFVGYGVHAPERGWDDFKGIDLKGKIAVFLVNDPDFEAVAGDDAKGRFGDRRMTYYGRWTYKYEEAARQGAIGALIVHDTAGAGYGWATVTAPAGENYDIVRSDPTSRILLQGWLSGESAGRLFAAAGLDLAQQRKAARRADFRPVELKGQTFSADLPVTTVRAESRNVLARLLGKSRPDEVVMFGAHWDAYGKGKADAQGRTIRPGANDDALGVAGVLELARAFKAAPPTDRSLVFALWTGGDGVVYAFEPDPAAYEGLCRHIALNGLSGRVHAFPVALTDGADGRAALARHGFSGLSRLEPRSARTIDVDAVSLDDFCGSRGISPDLIKIDVEGAELGVLRGAGKTIAALKPHAQVFVEPHPHLWAGIGCTADDIARECAALGLDAERIDGGRTDVWTVEGVCLRLRRRAP